MRTVWHVKGLTLLLCFAVPACATSGWDRQPGLPGELARGDTGTIAGIWREPGRGGLVLSIMDFGSYATFAVRRGCTITGGVLRPRGAGTYTIERYEIGFSEKKCGPWRSGPEVAPFAGSSVLIERTRFDLSVSSEATTLHLRRVVTD